MSMSSRVKQDQRIKVQLVSFQIPLIKFIYFVI